MTRNRPALRPAPVEDLSSGAAGPDAGSGQDDTAADATPRDGEVTVVAGDSFWSLAEGIAAEHLGRAPDDAEVVPVWEALIAANRDRLVVPDDPDLLLPGQRLRVDLEVRDGEVAR